MFRKAYPDEPESLTTFTITNATSPYIRSLTSLNSRFNLYMWGGNNKLLDAEKSGSTLFAGKAKCATCHYIPLFNGLAPPFFEEPESEVIGVPSNTSKSNAKPDSDFRSIILPNPSSINIHLNTPLRNIELSASYMHNGVYKTLEEVAEFYNKEAERA